MAKFRVTLTDEERCVLRKMVSSGKGAARKLLHGRILLQADADARRHAVCRRSHRRGVGCKSFVSDHRGILL